MSKESDKIHEQFNTKYIDLDLIKKRDKYCLKQFMIYLFLKLSNISFKYAVRKEILE